MSTFTHIYAQTTGPSLQTYEIPNGKRLMVIGCTGSYGNFMVDGLSLENAIRSNPVIITEDRVVTYRGGTYNGSDRTLIWYGILEDNI